MYQQQYQTGPPWNSYQGRLFSTAPRNSHRPSAERDFWRDKVHRLKQKYATLFHLEVTTNRGEMGINNEPPLWVAYYQIPGENTYLAVGQGLTMAVAMEAAAYRAYSQLIYRGYRS